ncbi:hypothetical protein [Roseimarinus sediminis]|jgi:hypothetical protein|uniref:hypothetical protein n=1 Tax=Roseimarinus sediminis TaxID=1610899 RepID=UPI003D228D0C
MKRIILTNAILIVFLISVLSVNAKGIVKATESFTISTNDAVEATLDFEKSWNINYGDSSKGITVYKNVTKKGEEYIVKNNFFEVRYVNTAEGFGVKSVKRSQSTVDPMINEAVIDQQQMSYQSKLSPKQLNEEKALNYIASFVPQLLNENYSHILN